MPVERLLTAVAPSGTGNAVIVPAGSDPDGRIFVCGWAAQEDTGIGGEIAELQIQDTNGNVLVVISLFPNESVREFLEGRSEDRGIRARGGGIQVVRLKGTSTVAVYYKLWRG